MNDNFPLLVYKLLDKNGYSFDKESLSVELTSHPEYPTLSALDDVLSAYKIEHLMLRKTINQLKEVDNHFMLFGDEKIFLAEFKKAHELQVLDQDLKCYSLDLNNFSNEYVVVLVDSQTNGFTFLSTYLRKYAANIIFLLVCFIIFIKSPWIALNTAFNIINLLSLTLAYFIFMSSNGSSYSFINNICGDDKNDCMSVLNSRYAYFFGFIKLTDVLFIGQGAILFYSILGGNSQPDGALSLAVFLSLPFLFYSLYAQIKLGRWCKLCLTIIGLSVIQIMLVILNMDFVTSVSNYFLFGIIYHCCPIKI